MTNLNKNLVIIGAGGHAKVCYDVAKLMSKWNKIIVLDDKPINDYFEIAGPIKDAKNYIEDSDFFVAIGDNKTRKSIVNKLMNSEVKFTRLIHPHSVIGTSVSIDTGTVVMAGTIINSATKIGRHCIINTSSSIDHDNIIGDFVHVSPGVNIAGRVTLGNNTWIGVGSTVINDINIESNITVGAGSLVLKDLVIEKVYFGVPVA